MFTHESENHPTSKKRPPIWAVGGGKGGVGKSMVTANLSLSLALLGKKVVCIDLDLGGANLHTCLGVGIPELTLSDYLNKKVKSMKDLLTPTLSPNLWMISGAQDELGIANLKHLHKNKILASLSELDVDYIILDLGAGTSFNTLDFFLTADKGILTILPEPTSIENTYRFIKAAYYRRLKTMEELLDIEPLLNQVMNSKMSASLSPVDMIKKVTELNPEMGEKLSQEITKFRPHLIMNQARSQADIDIGFSIKTICKKYFGIDLEYLGYLDYDASVWQSVKKRRPLIMEFPHSKLVVSFDRIIQKLIT
ncbi:MAG: P-loop NTPase [Bacteriovoracaceae bacterium]|nr:P-loop NTPase [Bacteriovoracaceae bacterium]